MILWLTNRKGYHPTIKIMIQSALGREGVPSSSIIFDSLHHKVPALDEHKPKGLPLPVYFKAAQKNLDHTISLLKPKLIVCGDEDTLRVITGVPYTLATTRGSVYDYHGTPCIVIDAIGALYRSGGDGKFIFQFDLAKIARYATGRKKNEPAFDLTICTTVGDVRYHASRAAKAIATTLDVETAHNFITCIGYTYLTHEGYCKTFVVPFFDPFCEEGAYWKTEAEEIEVRRLLKEFHLSAVPKIMQNGTYDCAWLLLQNMPVYNYIYDTANMMHCIWPEARKRLNDIASYFVDSYVYWKDESKGVKEDGFGKDHTALERYWRYNGLDNHYTMLCFLELLYRMVRLPWAMYNYNVEFSLSAGPCLAASMRGILVNQDRHAKIMGEQLALSEAGKADILRFTEDVDFNIASTQHVAYVLYDFLGVKSTRIQRKGSKYSPRSTDEKVLKLMKEQGNVVANNFIDRLLAAKKPGTVLSKFGNKGKLLYNNRRFLSWHNAAGTETWRFNSGHSQFWTGTNGQNIEPFLEEFFVADSDYIFVDFDYSASDDWFIAYHAQDLDKIALLNSGKDVHCYHASVFFAKPYEAIYAGYKAKEPWVVHAITGVRQQSKKIAHGKNFRMGAAMMYNLMGRDPAIATAQSMGYSLAARMSDKELIGVVQQLGDKYDHPKHGMYRRIRAWQDETVVELKANKGLVTNAFGMTRKFLGDPDDHGTQRELSAFYGQSGTSGNTNRSLREVFYRAIDDGKSCLFLLQVHDSLRFLIHRSVFREKIQQIKDIMEKSVTINNRTFRVPVNVECGLTGGKKMLAWTPEVTYLDIIEFERKTFLMPGVGKNGKTTPARYPIMTDAERLAALGNFTFGAEMVDDKITIDAADAQLAALGLLDEDAQNGDVEDADLTSEGV